MGIYPWASIDVGGEHDKQMQYNLELFRRILESLAKEPVEIISEPDYLSGMRQCRVHFRYSQFYMMVDINIMRYGDVPIEKLAHDCYERMMNYRRENNRENVNSAYIQWEAGLLIGTRRRSRTRGRLLKRTAKQERRTMPSFHQSRQ